MDTTERKSSTRRSYRLPSFHSQKTNHGNETQDETMTPKAQFEYNLVKSPLNIESVDDMLRGGTENFDAKYSSLIKRANGGEFHSMDIRFKNLSIETKVSIDDSGAAEIPTVWTATKDSFLAPFKSKKTEVRHILKNINGSFTPGTMTLILGQPGSGKSSLMKILSGRFPLSKSTKLSGNIEYNGVDREEILHNVQRCVTYVDQYDHHIPVLSVLETFQFAHECMNGKNVSEWERNMVESGHPHDNEKAMEAMHAVHGSKPEMTVRYFGLEKCKNTVIGNSMLRGVSGGEKKRVTSGEMCIGNTYALLMDEISTGLDSAATYDIIKSMKSMAKKFNKTVVISLLQPPPEVFDLFDEVLLVGEGEIIYQGPRESVLPHFLNLGYKCPPRKDAADFLQDIGTSKAAAYKVPEMQSDVPVTAAELAERFRQTSIYQENIQKLHEPTSLEKMDKTREIVEKKSTFEQSYWESTKTVMRRQFVVAMRNKAFIYGRSFMVLLMGLLYGLTYFDLDANDQQVLIGFIFAAVMFVSLGQASNIPTFMEAREVFYKQRRANFYRTSSYVFSTILSQTPFAIAEAVMYGSITYWLAGLAPGVEQFLIHIFTFFTTNITLCSFFFFITAISPDLNIAQPIANVFILIFVVFGGFVVTKDTIPDYFIWLYWINPYSWIVRSLSVNQYHYKDYNVCLYNGIDYCAKYGAESFGDYRLRFYSIDSGYEWVWYGIMYLIIALVAFMIFSTLTLEYIRYEAPSGAFVGSSEEEINHEVYESFPDSPENQSDKKNSIVDHVLEVKSEVPFVPVTLAFKNLWYSVPLPGGDKGEEIDLLKGVSGFALPGTMTALMGSSGAGKTTLMDVIAGRKTGGRIQGDILLNGYPADELSIRRSTGYCEQMDIHSESATVREALTFSAFLRQSSDISDNAKRASVQECLDLLGLNDIADSIIRGMSTEQRKRITIGVELAAQPSILFLDEPTSGLDARSALMIMHGVKKIANSGRTVVCTIHQPSSEVFQVFDSLLLLKRGGQSVFFGELGVGAKNLIDYFMKIPSTAEISDGYNPATWMLEVIGAGVGTADNGIDYAECFEKSDLRKELEEDIEQEGVGKPSSDLPEVRFETKRASTSSVQFGLLLKRFLCMYWRTPTYNFTRFALQVFLSLLFGLIYLDSDYTSYSGINSGIGMVFLTTVFVGIVAFNSALHVISEERAVFYRERVSQTYNSLWYFSASGLAEIPYVYLSGLLFTIIYFPMVGFTGYSRFFWYWINLSTFALGEIYMAEFFIFSTPSMEVAAIMGILLNSIFILLMGFNPPESAIPSGLRWLSDLCYPKYALGALSASVFADCSDISDVGCQTLRNTPEHLPEMTVKMYVEENFQNKYDDMWFNFAITVVFVVIFRILTAFSMRYMNFQNR